jgi:hypothetical protein
LVKGLCFSRDGDQLLASDGLGQIHAWDLRLIRSRLAAMNLNWETPQDSLAGPAPPPQARRLKVVSRRASQNESTPSPWPRDPRATGRQIDLSRHYNAALNKTWFGGERENSLATLPVGLKTFAKVTFDVRGLIQLSGKDRPDSVYPAQVRNLPIGLACRQVHFLHGTQNTAAEGQAIGRYVIHFSNGVELTVPILYGHTLRDWWQKPREPASPAGLVEAWSGSNAESNANHTNIRLFKWTWDNPFADLEIRSIDFLSDRTSCAPFLVAVTVE